MYFIVLRHRHFLSSLSCNICRHISHMDQESSVGIATRYGLEVPGIESQWERDFPQPSRPVLSSTQPPIQRIPGLFPGSKSAGRGVEHPPPPSADVKERVELYLYSPTGSSWPVLGWNLPLPLLGLLPQNKRPGFTPTQNNNIVICTGHAYPVSWHKYIFVIRH